MLRLPAPSLIVLVGPGASGKSTWAAEHFAASEIVSSDVLRGMVGAGEHDQTSSAVAFDLLEQIVTERLRRRMTTVVDTLGFDAEARRRWIELARANDVPAHAVVFDTDPETCLLRNEERGRSIPKTVLRKQVARFKQVRDELEAEDFDGTHLQQHTATSAVVTTLGPIERRSGTAGAQEATSGHTFGLIVSRFDWDSDLGATLVEIARRAEAAGFRDIWVMDHFRQIRNVGRPWEDIPEAYTALGFMAAETSKIRLGAMVTGITHRPPIVLGKMVATLDVLSQGRANCGLGIGWDAEEHVAYGLDFPTTSVRYAMLEETLEMLPLLWGKGTPEFDGEYLDSPGLISYPRPVQDRIPILIGGSGEKRTLRLVARYADACNVFGDPDRVRHKVSVLERHCAEVGRDPSQVEVTHLTNALVSQDRTALRDRVDSQRDRNTTAEEFMKRNNAGTVDDLEELFAAYREAGADHSIVSLPDVVRQGSLEDFGQVIARFT